MTPARLLFGLPRCLIASALLFLHGCHPCPARDGAGVTMPGPVTPAPSPFLKPRTVHVNWHEVEGATRYTLYAWTNEVQAVVYDGPETNCVVTNLARRVTWNFAVTATDTNGAESEMSAPVSWPVPSPPITNHVVTVSAATATAASPDGPWVTNSAILFQATNPPGMGFWRQAGLSIAITNF